jgi:hypothetical protein
MREVQEERSFNFDEEYLKRYPGLCMQCGSRVCVCPAIPQATIGRMAKELGFGAEDAPLISSLGSFAEEGKASAEKALESVGGYPGLVARLPFDRGDANHALVQFCMKMAAAIDGSNPELASSLRAEALRLGDSAKEAGTSSGALQLEDLFRRLSNGWQSLDQEVKRDITKVGGIAGNLGEMLDVNARRSFDFGDKARK